MFVKRALSIGYGGLKYSKLWGSAQLKLQSLHARKYFEEYHYWQIKISQPEYELNNNDKLIKLLNPQIILKTEYDFWVNKDKLNYEP